MYQRKSRQISILEDPAMFGGIQLDPKNKWIELSKLIPWAEFEDKYAENFQSSKGQPAIPARTALGALLVNERYRGMSDDDVTEEIGMNPYLQYFIGMPEFKDGAPFHPSMMSRFRKRITPEMLAWVNDRICGVPKEKTEEDPEAKQEDNHKEDNSQELSTDAPMEVGAEATSQEEKNDSTPIPDATEVATELPEVKAEDDHKNDSQELSTDAPTETGTEASAKEEKNEGTLILDATCAPQYIRFPQDASLLNEARENLEQMIDILHENKMTDGEKPRTYRETAKHEFDRFSKKRHKTYKDRRKAVGKQLQYVRRDLGYIDGML